MFQKKRYRFVAGIRFIVNLTVLTQTSCAPPTHFFKGRCYDVCPIQTYALNRADSMEDFKSEEMDQPINLQDDEELQSIDRKKRTTYFYHNADKLGYSGPKTSDSPIENKIICEPCHPSCMQCFGPLSSQCSVCIFGRQLKRTAHTNETYCINFSERSSGNAASIISTHSLNANISSILIVSVSILIVFVIFFIVIKKRNNTSNSFRKRADNDIKSTYAYDRVALFAEEDNPEEEASVSSAAPSAIQIDHDNDNNSKLEN